MSMPKHVTHDDKLNVEHDAVQGACAGNRAHSYADQLPN